MEALDKSPNIIYNIFNYEEPKFIFFYGVLLIIFIFISSRINFSTSILIGLVFYCIIVYYIYTDRNLNNIFETEKYKEKFNTLETNNYVLKDYPKVVDIIFYMEDLKKYNLPTYLEIVALFEEFCTLYKSCNTDYNLIDSLYQNMIYTKIKILTKTNNFVFNTRGFQIEKKIANIEENIKKVLNSYLDEIVLIQKKKIYYNGYNNKSSLLDTSGVIPYNILYDPNPLSSYDFPNFSDLYVY
jgi:hypothetical protein